MRMCNFSGESGKGRSVINYCEAERPDVSLARTQAFTYTSRRGGERSPPRRAALGLVRLAPALELRAVGLEAAHVALERARGGALLLHLR